MISDGFFNEKKVLLTGHTGFKGTWLSVWLSMLGAQVYGYSLFPSRDPKFELTNITGVYRSELCSDVRDLEALTNAVKRIQPDFVFHLAAQSLVPFSFKSPHDTWTTNLLGTVNILESLRDIKDRCTVVLITSDKVYENKEWFWGYRETDQLGGVDPYSASKSGAELAIRSYIETFFSNQDKIRIAVGRAGNVIGGGDWSDNRIVPDCIRSWSDGKSVALRNPLSTRPWQHVLEPLSGYLTLATIMHDDISIHGEAFNFGPREDQNKTVLSLVKEMSKHMPEASFKEVEQRDKKLHESGLLKLSIDKADSLIHWKPRWPFEKTVLETMLWYKHHRIGDNESIMNLMRSQIDDYNKGY